LVSLHTFPCLAQQFLPVTVPLKHRNTEMEIVNNATSLLPMT